MKKIEEQVSQAITESISSKYVLRTPVADMTSNELAILIAHELRSPLSAIMVATSQLGNIEPARRKLIDDAIQRFNDIADNLATFR